MRNCDAGRLISNPMSLNPVVKPRGVLMALNTLLYNADAPDPNIEFSSPFKVSV